MTRGGSPGPEAGRGETPHTAQALQEPIGLVGGPTGLASCPRSSAARPRPVPTPVPPHAGGPASDGRLGSQNSRRPGRAWPWPSAWPCGSRGDSGEGSRSAPHGLSEGVATLEAEQDGRRARGQHGLMPQTCSHTTRVARDAPGRAGRGPPAATALCSPRPRRPTALPAGGHGQARERDVPADGKSALLLKSVPARPGRTGHRRVTLGRRGRRALPDAVAVSTEELAHATPVPRPRAGDQEKASKPTRNRNRRQGLRQEDAGERGPAAHPDPLTAPACGAGERAQTARWGSPRSPQTRCCHGNTCGRGWGHGGHSPWRKRHFPRGPDAAHLAANENGLITTRRPWRRVAEKVSVCAPV